MPCLDLRRELRRVGRIATGKRTPKLRGRGEAQDRPVPRPIPGGCTDDALSNPGYRNSGAMAACSSSGAGDGCTLRNRDRLLLRGMLFHGHHGVFAEENKLGQKFLVDVDAWMDLRPAGESDDIEQSVSYADIYKQIKGIVEGPPFKLVESVASAIAQALLSTHPSISDVRVKVCKPHVAVEGVLDYLGVEIFRSSNNKSSNQGLGF